MQTFLPYPDFEASAKCLDRQRLGKQRVEVLQILNALRGLSRGWVNHPATRMWVGHGYALCIYGQTMCNEWIARGYNDTCWGKIQTVVEMLEARGATRDAPRWFGLPSVHVSHQSNLIRKDPDYYGPKFPGVPPDLPYVWVV